MNARRKYKAGHYSIPAGFLPVPGTSYQRMEKVRTSIRDVRLITKKITMQLHNVSRQLSDAIIGMKTDSLVCMKMTHEMKIFTLREYDAMIDPK